MFTVLSRGILSNLTTLCCFVGLRESAVAEGWQSGAEHGDALLDVGAFFDFVDHGNRIVGV